MLNNYLLIINDIKEYKLTADYSQSHDFNGINKPNSYLLINSEKFYNTDGDGEISVDLHGFIDINLEISLIVEDNHAPLPESEEKIFIVENPEGVDVIITHNDNFLDSNPSFWELSVSNTEEDLEVFIDGVVQTWNHDAITN